MHIGTRKFSSYQRIDVQPTWKLSIDCINGRILSRSSGKPVFRTVSHGRGSVQGSTSWAPNPKAWTLDILLAHPTGQARLHCPRPARGGASLPSLSLSLHRQRLVLFNFCHPAAAIETDRIVAHGPNSSVARQTPRKPLQSTAPGSRCAAARLLLSPCRRSLLRPARLGINRRPPPTMRFAHASEYRVPTPSESGAHGSCCHDCCHGKRFFADAPLLLSGSDVMALNDECSGIPGRHVCRAPRPAASRCTGSRSWFRRASSLPSASAMRLRVLLVMLFRVSLAAFIPFDNCLPDSYQKNNPVPLQWVPQSVDASFDTANPKHTLRVTMWGNVTGSFTNVSLPPPDSPDWTDKTKLDGKILGEPEPNTPEPKLTTLHSKIEVLTYEPWSENTNFCNTSLSNASCPLAPVFNADPE